MLGLKKRVYYNVVELIPTRYSFAELVHKSTQSESEADAFMEAAQSIKKNEQMYIVITQRHRMFSRGMQSISYED